jgi:hypothetical protein
VAAAVALLARPALARVLLRPTLWVLVPAAVALWVWNIGFNPTFT